MAKAGLSREKIIKSYLKLCFQLGVEEVTLQMIAKESKLSFGSVHYYFGGDKKKIRLAALEYVATEAKQFADSLMEKKHKKEKVNNFVLRYFAVSYEWIFKHPDQAAYWLYFYYLATVNNNYKKVMLLAREHSINRFEAAILKTLMNNDINMNSENVKSLCIDFNNYMVGALITFIAKGKKNIDKLEEDAYFEYPQKIISHLQE